MHAGEELKPFILVYYTVQEGSFNCWINCKWIVQNQNSNALHLASRSFDNILIKKSESEIEQRSPLFKNQTQLPLYKVNHNSLHGKRQEEVIYKLLFD